MTKSELIELLARRQPQLAYKDIELSVKTMLEHMTSLLASGERIGDPRLWQFFPALPPAQGRPQSKSGEPVFTARQICPALQARQTDAGKGR